LINSNRDEEKTAQTFLLAASHSKGKCEAQMCPTLDKIVDRVKIAGIKVCLRCLPKKET